MYYFMFRPACSFSFYRVVPKLSTPFQGVLDLAYNTTVVKYAPVKHPYGVLNFGI
jgi:hypothetical protein